MFEISSALPEYQTENKEPQIFEVNFLKDTNFISLSSKDATYLVY